MSKLSFERLLWITGILASLILLILFLCLQARGSEVLNLSTKWLIVAFIPLILLILKSNFIQKFKGFGIELETRLQDPIGRISLAVTEASTYLLGDQKQSMPYLNSLPPEKRRKIQRLSFVEGRAGYYSLYAIM